GAAVVEVDHVVKDKESRGRFAIGGQHKLAGVDVAYLVALREPFGRGRVGELDLLVKKDRPGFIRQYADGEKVASVRLISDGEGAVEVAVEVPSCPSGSADHPGNFRPTTLMERLSEAIELKPGMGVREVRASIRGNNDAKEIALGILIAEDYVRVEPNGQKQEHFSDRLYRANEDPKVVAHD
ncbi:MAG TPA: hypothetical protein VIJ21_05825, partial [Solirubrobacterales bacterium]